MEEEWYGSTKTKRREVETEDDSREHGKVGGTFVDTADGERLFLLAFYYFNAPDIATTFYYLLLPSPRRSSRRRFCFSNRTNKGVLVARP